MQITRRATGPGLAALALAAVSLAQSPGARIAIDKDDIAGVGTGARAPGAGVWVIAETGQLPTKFARIVVTDERGRYLLPDLPRASYSVWVRGYGLVDSPKVAAEPGKTLDLKATPAPSAAAAAEYYPAGYWWSLLKVPEKSEFPGTGPTGNGISPNMKSQAEFLRTVKSGGCLACHALGTRGTRALPKSMGELDTPDALWLHRLQS